MTTPTRPTTTPTSQHLETLPHPDAAEPTPGRPRHAALVDQPVIPSDYEMSADLKGRLVTAGVDVAGLSRSSGIRGRFSTGVVLAAAIFGPGGDDAATTIGQVWCRLGATRTRPSGMQTRRLHAVAEYYGLPLPQNARDGAPSGKSVLRDPDALRAACVGATSVSKVCSNLGMSASGTTFERIRQAMRHFDITLG